MPTLGPNSQPSFDCLLAKSEVEQIICTDTLAAIADRDFADFWNDYLYQHRDHPFRDELIDLQTHWLDSRTQCLRDTTIHFATRGWCIAGLYIARQNALTYTKLVQGDSAAAWHMGLGPSTGDVYLPEVPEVGTAIEGAWQPLMDLAEAQMQSLFDTDRTLPGDISIFLSASHGRRLTQISWNASSYFVGAAHGNMLFREFLFDRSTGGFVQLSDLFRPEAHEAVREAILDALRTAADASPLEPRLDNSLDELNLAPLFDGDGNIVAFENYSLAESFGGYAGRVCFFGLQVSAQDLAQFASAEYVDLFSLDTFEPQKRGYGPDSGQCRE